MERLAVKAELWGRAERVMFRYSMIRSGLRACLVYLTHSQVLIRPFVPPTGENPLFAGASGRCR